MAGWRVGFAAGNREMIHALARIKSYLDYGMPQAIQIGAIVGAARARRTWWSRTARSTASGATR
jgi:aspartate/methionine/tyrosine aminotransferase